MNANPLFYFFTNQRNLLQSLTKGYLTVIDYWDRKSDDFVGKQNLPVQDFLFFAQKQLNLSYTYIKDKTLSPVAVSISEKKLNQIGFKVFEAPSGDLVYYGDEVVPIELFKAIVFRSNEELRNNQLRYGNYIDLVEQSKYQVNPRLFKSQIDIPPEFIQDWIGKKYSSESESAVSKRIGAWGNFLIYLQQNKEFQHIIIADVISHIVKYSESDVPLKNLKDTFTNISRDWEINPDEVQLNALLLIQNQLDDLSDQIHCYNLLTKSFALKLLEDEIKLLFLFLNGIENVFMTLNDRIKKIGRSELLERIEKQFVSDLHKNKIKNGGLLGIIRKIQQMFDYQTDREDVIDSIDHLDSVLARIVMRGFEIYVREPVEIDKLKKAVDLEKFLPSEICKGVPFFFWGKARGAFAFEPISKRLLLETIPSKAMHSMIFKNEEFERYHFDKVIEAKVSVRSLNKENIQFGSYILCIHQDGPFDKETYEEYEKTITTENGISIKLITKDEYKDVSDKLNDLISDFENLSDDYLSYFTNKIFYPRVDVLLGDIPLSIKREPKIVFSDSIEIIFTGDGEVTIEIPKTRFVSLLKNELYKRYGGKHFAELKLFEKRDLREYFFPTRSEKTKSEAPEQDNKGIDTFPTESWKIIDIKQYMNNNGISYKGCRKKTDYLERIKYDHQESFL